MLMVNFDRYGDSTIDFFVYAFTTTTGWGEFHRIKEEVLLEIAAIVEKHGAEFAFPTRTVHHNFESPPTPPFPNPTPDSVSGSPSAK